MRNVFVFIFPKVHVFDFAGAVQVLYEANSLGEKRFQITYASSQRQVQTEQHISFGDLKSFDAISIGPRDVICIPGVDFTSLKSGELDASIEQARTLIEGHSRNGGAILSICTGSLILMKLGLLNRRKASTHWKCFAWVKENFPSVILQEENLFSCDSNIYTSAGMTTGIDMTLAYLDELYSPLVAAEVARELVINVRRENIGDQKNTFLNFKNKFHPVVYQVQQILQSRLHELVTVRELADEVAMSERNLNRLFSEHQGKSIATYRNEVKLKEGRKLLIYSDLSIKEIANSLGYASEAYFNRIWKKKYQVAPGKFRKLALKSSLV